MKKIAAGAPDFADIAAAVRALAEAHEPTRAQLEHEDAEATRARHKRMLEALLFAAETPLSVETLRARMPEGADVVALLAALQAEYAGRGVNLARAAGKWRLQTAADVAPILRENREEPVKLSRAALETLAIVAYHQPATRAEIEAVRGVAASKGTLDILLEIGWVRARGRRRAPGRPLVYVTTDAFLEHFGLESLEDLPGKADLKAAGLLDETAPDDFEVPDPTLAGLQDELPLEDEDEPEAGDFHVDYLVDGEGERGDASEPESED
jgi:segregation and condensation protein B